MRYISVAVLCVLCALVGVKTASAHGGVVFQQAAPVYVVPQVRQQVVVQKQFVPQHVVRQQVVVQQQKFVPQRVVVQQQKFVPQQVVVQKTVVQQRRGLFGRLRR